MRKKVGANDGGVFAELEDLGSLGEVRVDCREDAEFASHVVGLGGDGTHGTAAQDPLLCSAGYQVSEVGVTAGELFDSDGRAEIGCEIGGVDLFAAADGGCVRLHLVSLPAKREDVVAGARFAGVTPTVFDIGFDVGHGTGAERGDFAAKGDFENALVDDDHLFVDVLVGRVRSEARPEFGLMHFDTETGVRLAIKDGAGFILAVAAGADGEILRYL